MSETFDTSALHDIDRPTGPVAAAVLATGVGTFALGLLTTLNEASTSIHDFLAFSDDVGPLSGKTILAVVAYVGSWSILHALWRRQDRALRPMLIAAAVLTALGVLGTFRSPSRHSPPSRLGSLRPTSPPRGTLLIRSRADRARRRSAAHPRRHPPVAAPAGTSTPPAERSQFTGSALLLRSFSIVVHDTAGMRLPRSERVPAASTGNGRETATLVGLGGLCAAVLAAAVATAFVDAVWAAGLALAWLLLFAGVCFLFCVAGLSRRRT